MESKRRVWSQLAPRNLLYRQPHHWLDVRGAAPRRSFLSLLCLSLSREQGFSVGAARQVSSWSVRRHFCPVRLRTSRMARWNFMRLRLPGTRHLEKPAWRRHYGSCHHEFSAWTLDCVARRMDFLVKAEE